MEHPSKRQKLSRSRDRASTVGSFGLNDRKIDQNAGISDESFVRSRPRSEERRDSPIVDAAEQSYQPTPTNAIGDVETVVASVVQVLIDNGSSTVAELTIPAHSTDIPFPSYWPLSIPANPTVSTVSWHEATSSPVASRQSSAANSVMSTSSHAASPIDSVTLQLPRPTDTISIQFPDSSSQIILSSPPSTPLPSSSSTPASTSSSLSGVAESYFLPPESLSSTSSSNSSTWTIESPTTSSQSAYTVFPQGTSALSPSGSFTTSSPSGSANSQRSSASSIQGNIGWSSQGSSNIPSQVNSALSSQTSSTISSQTTVSSDSTSSFNVAAFTSTFNGGFFGTANINSTTSSALQTTNTNTQSSASTTATTNPAFQSSFQANSSISSTSPSTSISSSLSSNSSTLVFPFSSGSFTTSVSPTSSRPTPTSSTAFSSPTSSVSSSNSITATGTGEAGSGSPTGSGGAGSAPSSTAGNGNGSGNNNSVNTPVVVGSVVGGVAGLALILAILFYFLRWRRKRRLNATSAIATRDREAPPTVANPARATTERSSTAAPLASAGFFGRLRPYSGQTTATTETAPSERGFQNLGGRRIAPAIGSGDDGFGGIAPGEAREDLSGGSFYRDSQGFYGSPASPTSTYSAPGQSVGPAGRGSGPVENVPVTRPSPARTPVIQQGGFAANPRTPMPRSTPPPRAAASPAGRPSRDGIGRSHPELDGSRGSRFREDVG